MTNNNDTTTKSENKVKKAVFLIAGYGTRFLPASKVLPKHILPILDKPLIQYWVEEAVEAGIEEIIFVTGENADCIKKHFSPYPDLENILKSKNKQTLLNKIEKLHSLAKFTYLQQTVLNGDGGALQIAKKLINQDEPILLVFPDYLMPFENNTISNLVQFYEKTGKSILAADEVENEKVSSFGVLDLSDEATETHLTTEVAKITKFVEKPKTLSDAPSNLINTGIAILNDEILGILDQIQSTVNDGEIRVADAFTKHIQNGGALYALKPKNHGFDCGNSVGMLKASIYVALQDEALKDEVIKFMKKTLAY